MDLNGDSSSSSSQKHRHSEKNGHFTKEGLPPGGEIVEPPGGQIAEPPSVWDVNKPTAVVIKPSSPPKKTSCNGSEKSLAKKDSSGSSTDEKHSPIKVRMVHNGDSKRTKKEHGDFSYQIENLTKTVNELQASLSSLDSVGLDDEEDAGKVKKGGKGKKTQGHMTMEGQTILPSTDQMVLPSTGYEIQQDSPQQSQTNNQVSKVNRYLKQRCVHYLPAGGVINMTGGGGSQISAPSNGRGLQNTTPY